MLVGLLQGPGPTLGDNAPEMANQRYRIGVKLYQEGRYADAAREFEVGLDLYPQSPRLAFNLGRALERAGELHGSIAAYRRYLGLETDVKQKAEVERIVAALARRLDAHRAQITVRSRPAGGRIYLDGKLEPAGTTPAQLTVEPGAHRVRVELARHVPETHDVEVSPGATEELDVVLDEAGGLWRRPTGYAALGVGAAALVVGGVLYGAANSTADDAESIRGDVARHAALEDDFDSQHTAAWVAIGAGAAIAAVGGALVWWGPDEVALAAHPGGAVVFGRW